MSFVRAEMPNIQKVMGALDLALVFPEAEDIPTPRLHVMDKDWIAAAMARDPVDAPGGYPRTPDAPSRIIKSSGTTGAMKYMIRSVENQEFIYRTAQFCGGYTQRSRFFAAGGFFVSAYHAAAVTCIRAGGVCVYDTRQPLAAALSSYAITHASFLVHTLMQILGQIPDDYLKPPDLKILTIGSPLSAAVRDRLLTTLAAQVSETYGTNETSTISTIDARGRGVTLPGVEAEVMDGEGRPVLGKPGWIRVRSPACVRAYLHDPAATEKLFRGGWFYPGDIGVKENAHTLRVIGRADSLLNIRGMKTAPEAFEEKLLAALPARDVCLLTIPDRENVEQVVLAVVLPPDAVQDDFTAKLEQVMPSVFGTARIVYVSHIPRTQSGKIERHALRQALGEHPNGPACVIAPPPNLSP